MDPQTFQLAVSPPPDVVARPGFGVNAAFVPAADGYPALVVIGCDPEHDPGRPIGELAPAAMRFIGDTLGGAEAVRWVAIDTWGRFFQARAEWPAAVLSPVSLERLGGGTGIDAFLREFGGAGETALEMLSALAELAEPVEDSPTARQFLEAVELHGKLPAPGALYRQFATAADSGDVKAMAAAIQLDPVVAATIINYANAAAFAAAGKTASVPAAVQRLGSSFVRRVVFVAEMMTRYRHGACPRFDYLGYWRNAIATGAAMRGLMDIYDIPGQFADDVLTAGLVSGLGWLAVAETFPDLMLRYVDRIALEPEPAQKARAQREVFPCPIRRVTERFLTLHEFPDPIRAAVAETAGEDRRIFDCLAGGVRVAQILAPFACLAEPPAAEVPEACRREWRHWQDVAGLRA